MAPGWRRRTDPQRLIAAVDELLELEKSDAKQLKNLQRTLKDVRKTTMWSLLTELMALDTQKHIHILEFLRDHAKQTAGDAEARRSRPTGDFVSHEFARVQVSALDHAAPETRPYRDRTCPPASQARQGREYRNHACPRDTGGSRRRARPARSQPPLARVNTAHMRAR